VQKKTKTEDRLAPGSTIRGPSAGKTVIKKNGPTQTESVGSEMEIKIGSK
jgi:hypothetical protein